MSVTIDTVEGDVERPQPSSGEHKPQSEAQDTLDASKLRAMMARAMRRQARIEAD